MVSFLPPHHCSLLFQHQPSPCFRRSDFPSLPPLLDGHSDVHLRNGIMNASRLALAHEPNAEQAFFVAVKSIDNINVGSLVYQKYNLSTVRYNTVLFSKFLLHLRLIVPFIFLAVKCNPDPYVIRLLAGLGTGFDCASNNEIIQINTRHWRYRPFQNSLCRSLQSALLHPKRC